MSKIKLSVEGRDELKRLQRGTRDTITYKKIAVILGLDAGFSYVTLKEILSLDETTIRRYENIYLADGLKEYLNRSLTVVRSKSNISDNIIRETL